MDMHAILGGPAAIALSDIAATMAPVSEEHPGSTQFMLLICGDETAAEHANDGCGGWYEEMTESGVLVGGGVLRAPEEGQAGRVRLGYMLVTDAPFAETREQICVFCIIECAYMKAAIEIASAHPAATYGTIV